MYSLSFYQYIGGKYIILSKVFRLFSQIIVIRCLQLKNFFGCDEASSSSCPFLGSYSPRLLEPWNMPPLHPMLLASSLMVSSSLKQTGAETHTVGHEENWSTGFSFLSLSSKNNFTVGVSLHVNAAPPPITLCLILSYGSCGPAAQTSAK